MKYYPVSFEKDGNEFVAVKMKGGFESDDENEVYEWILDYDSKQFDFEKFSKMPIEELMENKPINYYVFSDDSVGYAVIERHDYGEDKVDFYENEEILKDVLTDMYGEDIMKELLENEYYYDDSEYEPDEFDDGTWSLTLKKIKLKKQ